jgi:hypothetical protein
VQAIGGIASGGLLARSTLSSPQPDPLFRGLLRLHHRRGSAIGAERSADCQERSKEVTAPGTKEAVERGPPLTRKMPRRGVEPPRPCGHRPSTCCVCLFRHRGIRWYYTQHGLLVNLGNRSATGRPQISRYAPTRNTCTSTHSEYNTARSHSGHTAVHWMAN